MVALQVLFDLHNRYVLEVYQNDIKGKFLTPWLHLLFRMTVSGITSNKIDSYTSVGVKCDVLTMREEHKL
jgi:hypothetical protein